MPLAMYNLFNLVSFPLCVFETRESIEYNPEEGEHVNRDTIGIGRIITHYDNVSRETLSFFQVSFQKEGTEVGKGMNLVGKTNISFD